MNGTLKSDLNLAQIDGLHQPWASRQLAGIEGAASSGDNLAATPVDGVSVQCDVMDVEPDGSHVFVAHATLHSNKEGKMISCCTWISTK